MTPWPYPSSPDDDRPTRLQAQREAAEDVHEDEHEHEQCWGFPPRTVEGYPPYDGPDYDTRHLEGNEPYSDPRVAFEPFELECYICDLDHPPKRKIRATKIVDKADPTEAYLLECGHTVI